MIFFKKTETTGQNPGKARDLTGVEIETVSGGLNPQPLPPRYLKTISSLPFVSAMWIGTL